jgi:hypothetical protein
VWASRADPAQTADLRLWLPGRPLLVSLPRHSPPALVVRHYDLGADLVIEDEGVTYAAAALAALGRRLAGRPPSAEPPSAELPAPACVHVARG